MAAMALLVSAIKAAGLEQAKLLQCQSPDWVSMADVESNVFLVRRLFNAIVALCWEKNRKP